jgi:hypothetical protein
MGSTGQGRANNRWHVAPPDPARFGRDTAKGLAKRAGLARAPLRAMVIDQVC